MIVAYAPTETADLASKEGFHGLPEDTLRTLSNRDIRKTDRRVREEFLEEFWFVFLVSFSLYFGFLVRFAFPCFF